MLSAEWEVARTPVFPSFGELQVGEPGLLYLPDECWLAGEYPSTRTSRLWLLLGVKGVSGEKVPTVGAVAAPARAERESPGVVGREYADIVRDATVRGSPGLLVRAPD